jgi:putative membrane protein
LTVATKSRPAEPDHTPTWAGGGPLEGDQAVLGKLVAGEISSPSKSRFGNRLHNTGLGLVLVGLSGWLEWRLLDGTLSYYLHPRFNLLVALTGLSLNFLGGWLIWRQFTAPSGRVTHLGVAIPVGLIVLIGLVVMPRPLTNTAASLEKGPGFSANNASVNRALTESVQKQDWNNPASLDTLKWNLLDWSAALNNSQRATLLVGLPVDVTGFVVNTASNNSRYFLLARYVVVCCTADSTALRLPVITSKSVDLEDGQWVRVRGSISQGANGGFVFSAVNLESVAQPAQPYIYP